MNTKNDKHMTLEDRIEIEECLRHGMTFKDIASRIDKDQTTISKEVRKPKVLNRNIQQIIAKR